ncbi:MAG: hypothetical protein CBC33_003160 [Coraliomargarita sp. TMED73]|nr:MAG: hypothetical protein CBC33_003160 [Coraliomargarita sp. TMED73]
MSRESGGGGLSSSGGGSSSSGSGGGGGSSGGGGGGGGAISRASISSGDFSYSIKICVRGIARKMSRLTMMPNKVPAVRVPLPWGGL